MNKLQVKQGLIKVTKTIAGKESITEEKIEIRPFVTDTANISVKAGATVNMGNYESGRVDIMISVPCYVEEIDSVFEFAKNWADKKMQKEYAELKEAADG